MIQFGGLESVCMAVNCISFDHDTYDWGGILNHFFIILKPMVSFCVVGHDQHATNSDQTLDNLKLAFNATV